MMTDSEKGGSTASSVKGDVNSACNSGRNSIVSGNVSASNQTEPNSLESQGLSQSQSASECGTNSPKVASNNTSPTKAR